MCTAFLQSWWRLMQHLSTAYQLLKLRQGSTWNSDGWQSFSVSACQKIEETLCFTWVYRKLLHILIPVAESFSHRNQILKLLYLRLKVCRQLGYLTAKDKRSNFRKSVSDCWSKCFSPGSVHFSGLISNKQLPVVHHSVPVTSQSVPKQARLWQHHTMQLILFYVRVHFVFMDNKSVRETNIAPLPILYFIFLYILMHKCFASDKINCCAI